MRTKDLELMEKIKAFAEDYVLGTGSSPSTTKIAEAVGISRGTAYKYLVEMAGRGMIGYCGGAISTAATEKLAGATARAAIVGSIPCGTPEEESESVEAYVSLPAEIFGTGSFYILRADGDSMTEAGIDTGDLVVIERTDQAKEGDIVVALVGNENTLKRLLFDRATGKVILHPENKLLSDIIVDGCVIQGVARSVIKTLGR